MRWLLTAEPRVQFQVTSCEIRDGPSGTEALFSPRLFVFSPLIIIPPLSRTHQPPPPDLTTQHIITFSFVKLRASALTWDLAGCRQRNLRHGSNTAAVATSCVPHVKSRQFYWDRHVVTRAAIRDNMDDLMEV
jgi:hypothetical protein